MKNIISIKIFVLILFLISIFANAQLQKINDWKAAQTLAKEKSKNILIILTGSEWCKPCIKLEKNVLNTSEFLKFAEENLIIFEINLPRHWDLNSEVVKSYFEFKAKYNANALPSLILVNPDGKELAKISNGLSSKEKVIKILREF